MEKIHEYQHGKLPSEFYEDHDYCFFLHDIMTCYIIKCDIKGLISIKLKADQNELDKISKLDNLNLYLHLKENHYDLCFELTAKQCFCALLFDALNYIHFALLGSTKGWLTATYSLSRKPFLDNLFYLERLLVEKDDFVNSFIQNNNYLPNDKYDKQKKKQLIHDAAEHIFYKNWIDPDFIYYLIYEIDDLVGFYPLWQKAVHLHTNGKGYETEICNFNFIFSNDENKRSQWLHLYSYLPLLLFWLSEIATAIYKRDMIKKEHACDLFDMQRLAGLGIWLRLNRLILYDDYSKELLLNIEESIKNATFPCPICKTNCVLEDTVIENIYYNGRMKCSNCNTILDFFDNKIIRNNV